MTENYAVDVQELRGKDTFAVVEAVQRAGAPVEIAATYHSVVKALYWKMHDLRGVVEIGRAGIFYCLGQSVIVAASPDHVEELRSAAKALAYDVGSFTWPGWQEPGIDPTPEDLRFGGDCARLNLRLAVELKKPPLRVAMAYWLVGAHELAVRNLDAAAIEFRKALEICRATNRESEPLALGNEGYLALVGLCSDDESSELVFNRIVDELLALDTDDSKAYASQLAIARQVFAPNPGN